MVSVSAFKPLCPPVDRVSDVVTPPYDVMTADEARSLGKKSDASFIRVIRPDAFVDDSGEQLSFAAAALAKLVESGALTLEDEESLFILDQTSDDGAMHQRGIIGAFSTEDYDAGRIKKHEFTRPDKEDDRARHVTEIGANTGMVMLAHRSDATIAAIIDVDRDPDLVVNHGGVTNKVWRLAGDDAKAGVDAFANLDAVYIADGHHRAAAASRAAKAGCPTRFMCAAFSSDEMCVLGYHRVLNDFDDAALDGFSKRLFDSFSTKPVDAALAPATGHASVYMRGQWLDVDLSSGERLDVAMVQDEILTPLGVEDPRTDARLSFAGGSTALNELQRRVDDGEAQAVIVMAATPVEAMMAVADRGEVMPPKSTWFEPKLLSGLVVHRFSDQ